jgi:endonuclease YncB( thermonuclease family)
MSGMCKIPVSFQKKLAALAAVFFTAANLHVFAATAFIKLEGCHLIPKSANDGDSFHVRSKADEYIFRLYFVDAPETDKEFPDRVKEQAKYFGITPEQAVQIGKEAAAFTRSKLAGKSFTVFTRWQDAMGRSKLPRYYAFIVVDNNQSLAELLVANGLARIFGTPAIAPNGQAPAAFIAHLRVLETKAKHDHLGAWSVNATKMGAKTDDDWNSIFQKRTAPAQ